MFTVEKNTSVFNIMVDLQYIEFVSVFFYSVLSPKSSVIQAQKHDKTYL